MLTRADGTPIRIIDDDADYVDLAPLLPSEQRPRLPPFEAIWRGCLHRLGLQSAGILRMADEPEIATIDPGDLSELHRYYDRALGRPPGETAARAARR